MFFVTCRMLPPRGGCLSAIIVSTELVSILTLGGTVGAT